MDGVIVLGGGLSGLGCALHLPGCRLFEAQSHPGGHAYSHPLGGVHFDQGAHISHTRDDSFRQMIIANAGEVAEICPSIVRNVWKGRWLTYPVQNHLRELPLNERIRALTDLIMAHGQADKDRPIDYLAWCRAQYGEYLTETFYRAYTAKYWRVPMEELATDWLGGRLLPSQIPNIISGAFQAQTEEQAVFARFRYPRRGGFFGFFAPLYRDLPIAYGHKAVEIDPRRRTVRFQTGRLESYDWLASSIPLPDLIAICKDVPIELRDAAAQLRHTQLLCVNLIVNQPSLTDCHWFYIYDSDIEASRVSLPGNLAPGSVPVGQTALQAEIYRRGDEPLDPDVLTEDTVRQMGQLLHFDATRDVLAMQHVLVPRAYVISDHRRMAAVNAIRQWLELRHVFTMGLYGRWKYVWSDEAYRQGQETAEAIIQRACLPGRAAG